MSNAFTKLSQDELNAAVAGLLLPPYRSDPR